MNISAVTNIVIRLPIQIIVVVDDDDDYDDNDEAFTSHTF
jgi:hypothetical protein